MNTVRIYKDRIIGLLFLVAFLCYGIGRNLFESQNSSEQITGSFLTSLFTKSTELVLLFYLYIVPTLLKNQTPSHHI